ncbi:hypothetical protein PUNSTDRAFT_139035 [Punctularia strigosozonata HHB-11173 SS5]|uniref:Uncharacterized protein n=1 Tax=Punctularia strigosozonata (strain HHB-11173) TaxID=741275 RepID=R7S192_PUNST|nr:uncharacterized protein PUNSTDRAFT_139035 [Punctularia strigosozonata HHB-11173 SS5]EIN03993.1 hypothetical protein PUNSTDRAFT_139035 [Punctularia strigosozonata HHB-11173 SS5]
MASQDLPPWMTLATSTFTDAAGNPTATAEVTLELPLTYFGPSVSLPLRLSWHGQIARLRTVGLTAWGQIPLGPDWVWGGSTEPASIGIPNTGITTTTAIPTSAPATTTSVATTVPTASESSDTASDTSATTSLTSIGPSTSSIPSSQTAPVTSIAPTGTLLSSSPVLPSTLSSSSAIPTAVSGHTSHSRTVTLIAAIVGGVAGLFLIAALLIGCWLCWRRRRQRQAPLGTGWEMIYPEDPSALQSPISPTHSIEGERPQSPGEGGGEEDPFLQRSNRADMEMIGGARLVTVPPHVLRPSDSGGDDGGMYYVDAMEDRAFYNPDEEKERERQAQLTNAAATNAMVTQPQSQRNSDSDPEVGVVGSRRHSQKEDEQAQTMRDAQPQSDGEDDLDGTTAHDHDEAPDADAPLLRRPGAALWLGRSPAGLDRASPNPSRRSRGSRANTPFGSRSALSIPHSDAGEVEHAELLTATRVHTPYGTPVAAHPQLHGSGNERAVGAGSVSSASSNSILGLSGLARIGRFSWFRRIDSGASGRSSTAAAARPSSRATGNRSRPTSRPSWYTPRTPGANDVEAGTGSSNGAGLLGADLVGRRIVPPSSYMAVAQGDGERPISTVSGRSAVSSGNTIYYDAPSRPLTPGTPVTSAATAFPPVPPMPASFRSRPATPPSGQTPASGVATPTAAHLRGGDHPGSSHAAVPTTGPPAYEDLPTTQSQYFTPTEIPPGVDVLDLPIPRPASPFSTVSSTNSNRPRPKSLQFPPGLAPSAIPSPRVWTDLANSSSSREGVSPAASNVGSGVSGIGITLELEDAPPSAVGGWRTLASANDRRTTFGQAPVLVHPERTQTSDQGSLHSHVHSIPGSSRGSDSVPPSGRYIPIASIGSRSASSLHSGPRSQEPSGSSGETGGATLSHSGSISSDDRIKRGRRTRSPADLRSPHVSLGAVGGRVPRLPELNLPSSPLHLSPQASGDDITTASTGHSPLLGSTRAGTVSGTIGTTATNSSVSTHTSITDPSTGIVMHFPSVPWTSGQERDWPADAWSEFPGEDGMRCWGPPSRLFAMRSTLRQQNDLEHV